MGVRRKNKSRKFVCNPAGCRSLVCVAVVLCLAPTGVPAAVESGGALLTTATTTSTASSKAPVTLSENSAVAQAADDVTKLPQAESISAAVSKVGDAIVSAEPTRGDGGIQPASLRITSAVAQAYNAAETAYPVDGVTAEQARQLSPSQSVTTDAQKTPAPAIGEANGSLKLPYALVLALFALIGLVPVSRRKH